MLSPRMMTHILDVPRIVHSSKLYHQTASAAAAASIAAATGGVPAPAEAAASMMWEQVKVPFEDTIYDIDFDR